jgi:hypothetical protein
MKRDLTLPQLPKTDSSGNINQLELVQFLSAIQRILDEKQREDYGADREKSAGLVEVNSSLTDLANSFNAHVAKVTHYNSKLGADVAIAVANTWYTGVSLTLPAGTYLVTAQVTLLRNTSTAIFYSAKLNNGATNYASAGIYMPSVTNHIATIPLTTIIALTAETTITLQATGNQVSVIKAALVTNGAGNTATQISAVRIV